MKRPGWLGGRRPKQDGEPEATGDAEDGNSAEAEAATGRSDRSPAAKRGPAGSPPDSSRARRRLAARVGKASGAAPEPAEQKSPADSKPDVKGKGKRKQADRPAQQSRGKRADGSKGPKPLNRPRHQPGDGRRATADDDGDREQRRPRSAKGEKGQPGTGRGADSRRRGDSRGPARRRTRSSRRGSPSSRRRPRAVAGSFATALKRGGGATRRSAAAAVPKLGRRLLAALGILFALFFEVLGFVLGVLIAVGRVVAVPVRALSNALGRAARAASRLLTPARALAVVVAGAAILLALSQYADYRSISIGNDAYSGVQTVAPAPETGRLQTGDAHSYVFVPIAIACLLLLGAAVIAGRWRLLRLVTLAGAAAIVVALLVDRPAGLDPGDAAVSFEGVRAALIGGFYAQIAAGIVLIVSSSLLARELRLAGAKRNADDSGREPASRRTLPRRAGAAGSARA